MRAVILESAGAAPRLRDASLPDPEPGPGEAVLRVEACGFSHHDALIMEGTLRRGVTLPRVLGHEVAGTVCSVGEGVSTALLGVRAVVLPGDTGHRRDGGFAEMLAVPVEALVAAARWRCRCCRRADCLSYRRRAQGGRGVPSGPRRHAHRYGRQRGRRGACRAGWIRSSAQASSASRARRRRRHSWSSGRG